MKTFYVIFEDIDGNEETVFFKAPTEHLVRKAMLPHNVLQVIEFPEEVFDPLAEQAIILDTKKVENESD